MAFNALSVVKTGRLTPALGSYTVFAVGETTMASGTGTATASGLKRIEGIVGCVQGATGVGQWVICTATSSNTATLETVAEDGSASGTSVVMWIAWGPPLS